MHYKSKLESRQCKALIQMLKVWNHTDHSLSGKRAKNLKTGHPVIYTLTGMQNWTAIRWKINYQRAENKLIALRRSKNKNS